MGFRGEEMTREEAIRELEILKEEYWDDDGYGHETKQYYDTMLALDMAIEALEQEPKKGHWIPYLKEGLIVKCSECKSRYTLGYNFCPNCGADMREVVEE